MWLCHLRKIRFSAPTRHFSFIDRSVVKLFEVETSVPKVSIIHFNARYSCLVYIQEPTNLMEFIIHATASTLDSLAEILWTPPTIVDIDIAVLESPVHIKILLEETMVRVIWAWNPVLFEITRAESTFNYWFKSVHSALVGQKTASAPCMFWGCYR